jgi:hypothetical protein
MIVEVHEVRQRFAAQIATLDGYVEVDGGFDPSQAPSSNTRAFAVLVPMTLPNGTRDRDMGPMEVKSRVSVRIQAPIYQSGPARKSAMDDEIKAEHLLIRALMMRGDAWTHGIRIRYAGSERSVLPGDEWLQTDTQFDVNHTVSL